jgi:hypothetical protein
MSVWIVRSGRITSTSKYCVSVFGNIMVGGEMKLPVSPIPALQCPFVARCCWMNGWQLKMHDLRMRTDPRPPLL